MVPRPAGVRELMVTPAFAQRILDRILSHGGLPNDRGFPILDIHTQGRIPLEVLGRMRVILVAFDGAFASHVSVVSELDGDSYRLCLGGWKTFENVDPSAPPLPHGVHFWFGSAWRRVPRVPAV
ncbi:hypothetical protein HY630_02910 [Candidatus Uhrbacteria bacterium]|nr:hypothetical protein [Candidatus Uhrbacteria bacterium]